MRCSAVSLGVMARNAGTVPIGFTITKSELRASREYSIRFTIGSPVTRCLRTPSYGAWGQDGVLHAVDDFFVGRADRGQHAAELRPRRVTLAGDEIVRAKPRAARHGHELAGREIEVTRLDNFGLVKSLQHVRDALEVPQRFVHRRAPIGRRQIAAEIDSARAPSLRRVAGNFEDQVTFALGERLSCCQSVRPNSGI